MSSQLSNVLRFWILGRKILPSKAIECLRWFQYEGETWMQLKANVSLISTNWSPASSNRAVVGNLWLFEDSCVASWPWSIKAPSLSRSDRKNPSDNVILFHCIIHHKSQCAQAFPPAITEITTLVKQIVNKIVTKRFEPPTEGESLKQAKHHYSVLLLHNKVRWSEEKSCLLLLQLV